MKIINVSLDIETLDTDCNNAVVLSIGVAADTGEKLYLFLNLEEQILTFNRTLSANTLHWWLDTNPAMFRNLILRCVDAGYTYTANEALNHLYEFGDALAQHNKVELNQLHWWFNSPRFDAGNLQALAKQSGNKLPWTFREERDYRTLRWLARQKDETQFEQLPPKPDDAHDALVDATYQLEIISRCKTILNC